MEQDTNKTEKASDERQAAPVDAKPLYQTPVVMPLGELARGRGGHGHGCLPGMMVMVMGGCGPGMMVMGQCISGMMR